MDKEARGEPSPEQRSYKAAFELDETAQRLVEMQPEIIVRKAALLTLKTREEAAKPAILQLAESGKTGIAIALIKQKRERVVPGHGYSDLRTIGRSPGVLAPEPFCQLDHRRAP
jgi:hypothetical protein